MWQKVFGVWETSLWICFVFPEVKKNIFFIEKLLSFKNNYKHAKYEQTMATVQIKFQTINSKFSHMCRIMLTKYEEETSFMLKSKYEYLKDQINFSRKKIATNIESIIHI